MKENPHMERIEDVKVVAGAWWVRVLWRGYIREVEKVSLSESL